MSLEALKREAAALDEASRRELFAFLVSLREKQWAERMRSTASRLDDPDPKRWLTIEQVRAELDKAPEPADE